MSSNREFLMLAQTFDPDKHMVAGHYASIKYDGQRCLWDGGVSRGQLKRSIPWANQLKDERYKEEPYATGLWTRYGNVIHAPGWWLDKLPKGVVLDGELYIERGCFQELRTIVSLLEPDERWKTVRYLVFDAPSPHVVFTEGRINNPNFKKLIYEDPCKPFYQDKFFQRVLTFQQIQAALKIKPGAPVIAKVDQIQLPFDEEEARDTLFKMLDQEVAAGGEGIMLRAPDSTWMPKRSTNLLKVKPLYDAEAEIIGYVWGEGKYRGLMGALIVKDSDGRIFNLSGFTDEERLLHYLDGRPANGNPGFEAIADVQSLLYPRGSKVTYKYVSKTDDGYPREARYWRK